MHKDLSRAMVDDLCLNVSSGAYGECDGAGGGRDRQ